MDREYLDFTVSFLTEGDFQIGLGHVSRCITLAKEFKRKGANIFFVCNHKEGMEIISKASFEIISYSEVNQNGRVKELLVILNQQQVDLLIIDSYDVSEKYLYAIHTHFNGKICYIDDLNKFIYPVDILIHGSVLDQVYHYKDQCKAELILVGLEYNLLRDEFRNLQRKAINDSVKEIMLTAGGADAKNMTISMIEFFLKNQSLRSLRLNVVVGSAFNNKNEIKKISKEHDNIELYIDPPSISEVMIRSDIAITAAGVTVYELFATGTPMIALITSDSQKIFVEELEKMGCLINGGYIEEHDKSDFTKKIYNLIDDATVRKKMSLLTQNLLDGEGSTRVVDEILNYFQKKCFKYV